MELLDYEKKHGDYVRTHLGECTVLLRSNGAFPLEKPGKIAAYGCGVRGTVKGGTGSGEVNSRYFVTVEEGLRAAGFTITSEAWLDAYDAVRAEAKKQFIQDVKARAKANGEMPMLAAMGAVMPEPEHELPLCGEGDTAIYVLSRLSGEGNDRPVEGDVKLCASEKRDILALNEKYEKFMLILNTGGPVDLGEVSEVGNILVMSQLGSESGHGLADILLGRQNPSGKLSTTWSRWEDYCPIGDFGGKADTRYREGIYVGYRWFDAVGQKALYPFGYGLSYTSFETACENVRVAGEIVTVRARVTNTGRRAGKEVVQVYLSAPWGKLDKPWQDLAGFAKTAELAAGESGHVEICFKLRDLASYDEERSAFVLEAGDYIVRVGNSSADTKIAAVLTLEREVLTLQARRSCGRPDFADWRPEQREKEEIGDDVPHICVDAAGITPETAVYDEPVAVEDAVKSLSDEQLAYLNVGAAAAHGGVLSVIGNASRLVSGAAGESSDAAKEQGLGVMVMADGPAGLRLHRKFYRDKKGVHAIGAAGLPESMLYTMPAVLRWFLKRLGGGDKVKKGVSVEYQYCTALPIGTALAQSWNVELAEGCGDIVGSEMERFGVHFWLAPALNIHRSILCGRNFEYFSEDPLIGGKMAAALTRGVQKHPGCGTTIKHYCANNQETNRYTNNSQVSERALREIYLRGFEICVREAQPHALMTSYNLLNGEHTSERRDLCEDILRSEWGYQGIVMTDWLISLMPADKSSPYRKPRAALIAAAGGELVMPGDKKDIKDILAALRSGELTREQLEVNASRLYRVWKRLMG
ncbi:MAG: beta-glucosidase-related glycosidase [Ruminococcaceae bacterium]|nr:beta-glucosidase-related glycosidase [Oscillospiraceae bacterium]